MYIFSAVIYDGKKQHLIKQECRTDTEFASYLERQFGCHVCLWSSKELSETALLAIAASQERNQQQGLNKTKVV